MSNVWQSTLVLALVALAAAYSIWYLMPSGLRQWLGTIHRVLAKNPSCSSCSSCGKCATPSIAPKADSGSLPPVAQPITFHRRR